MLRTALHIGGLVAILLSAASVLQAETPAEWVKKELPGILDLYRHFHAHPELSNHEEQTAARFAAELKEVGCEVTTRVGGHGVVGLLKNGDGPTLMLRTDLDALPVSEQTPLPFASRVKVKDAAGAEVGVMHACGHDVHMTSLLGVARYLAGHKEQWQGTVMFLGQPAEERGTGAKAMLEDGLFTRFKRPDFAVALHVDPLLEAGKVTCRPGWALANVDSVDITVNGRGGHGAHPENAIDPVMQAAELIVSLQTIVSREIRATEPAVITVGSIQGGTKHNVIGDRCDLQLTVRSYSDKTRKHLLSAIERKARAVADSYRAPPPTIKFSEGTPSLYNDDALAARVKQILERTLGAEQVGAGEQSMGGEDFSQYGRAGVPIVMYRLGTISPARKARFAEMGIDLPGLHSPLYYPDADEALPTGVATMSAVALELLKKE